MAAKAREYAHAVSELRWRSADTLSSQVSGTRTRPYDVRAHFHDACGGLFEGTSADRYETVRLISR